MRKILLVSALAAAACSGSREQVKPDAAPAVIAAPAPEPSVDVSAIDRSKNPCDNFYEFACGSWIQKTEIPADRPAWFRSFSEINERNQDILKGILEASAAGKELPGNKYGKKLGDYYAMCMDEAKAETASMDTLKGLLARIDKVKSTKELADLLADFHLQGINAFFSFGSDQDMKDATQVIGVADQGGLGLPDRDYYLDPSDKNEQIRKAYREHVAKMFELTGVKPADAQKQADTAFGIEKQLAQVSQTRTERREPTNVYHRLERTGLEGLAPAFTWNTYFGGLGIPDIKPINVTAPDFFKGLNGVVQKTPLPDLKTYLKWQAIDEAASALGAAFVEEDFQFRSKNLTGEEKNLPRWKRCVQATDGAMGEALAQPFIAQTFAGKSKEEAQQMIQAIEDAFARNLDTLTWMDTATKQAAIAKLKTVFNKIGYPDKWRDYDKLDVGRTSYLENELHASQFEGKRQLAKIGKPVERGEWFMSPPTVNAYYNAQLNEMVFPAGILQPPFFSKDVSAAANFGAIGMVMGHELTHGFDDKGRKFDEKGDLRDWWSPEVGKSYEKKTQCIEDQYAKYQPLPGVNLNGKLTLGENIADVGGLKLALLAYRAKHPEPAQDGAGFSAEQRLFLSFAQGWCAKRREAYSRMLVTVDPHSPPEFRVNGVVVNLPEFAQAFSCPAGAPMAPQERCSVW
jgi:putative endopeptidase